jgi:hypothetical protein
MFQPIRRSFYQEQEPKKIEKDSKGSFIKNDRKVAYNRSGDVVTGSIISIKKNKWTRTGGRTIPHWSLSFELEVRGDDGVISIIKNPNSFVMI